MALLDEVRAVCARLAPHGWADLETFRHGRIQRHPTDVTRVRVRMSRRTELRVDRLRVLKREQSGPWLLAT